MASKLGALIAAHRKAGDLSLRELAKRVDKSPAFISMLENDESPPTVKEETLEAIARELGIDIDKLMGLAGKVPESARPESELEVALYRKVKELPKSEQEQLLRSLDKRPGDD